MSGEEREGDSQNVLVATSSRGITFIVVVRTTQTRGSPRDAGTAEDATNQANVGRATDGVSRSQGHCIAVEQGPIGGQEGCEVHSHAVGWENVSLAIDLSWIDIPWPRAVMRVVAGAMPLCGM